MRKNVYDYFSPNFANIYGNFWITKFTNFGLQNAQNSLLFYKIAERCLVENG